MTHSLCVREGGTYLSPREAIARLQSAFAYVEVDEEEGRRHVAALIHRLQELAATGGMEVDNGYIKRLKSAQRDSVYVYFGDDLGAEWSYLTTAIVPGEPLYFHYVSPAHEKHARPLLAKCAQVLAYEISNL